MSANNENSNDRRQRLAKELRANLKRRKAKARSQRDKDTAKSDSDTQPPR